MKIHFEAVDISELALLLLTDSQQVVHHLLLNES